MNKQSVEIPFVLRLSLEQSETRPLIEAVEVRPVRKPRAYKGRKPLAMNQAEKILRRAFRGNKAVPAQQIRQALISELNVSNSSVEKIKRTFGIKSEMGANREWLWRMK